MMMSRPVLIDADYVLMQFDKRAGTARRMYHKFVESGIGRKRPDLTGGGLIRSAGGWDALLSGKSRGFKSKGDERILGGGEFVERILQESEETLNNSLRLRLSGYDISKLADRVKELLGVNPLESPGRYKDTVKARRVFCY